MSNFIKLSNFPIRFGSFIPKPVSQNATQIIITNNKYHSGIFVYNTMNNTMTLLSEFAEQFKLSFHSQFIDEKNNELYLFGGYHQEQTLVYNFDTKKLKQKSTELEIIGSSPARSLYIKSTHQVLSCINGFHIYTFDDDTLKSYSTGVFHIDTFGIPLQVGNEIKVLSGSDDFILTTVDASNAKDLNNCEWNMYKKIKMPRIVSSCHYFDALAVDNIAIIFYFGFNENQNQFLNEIWCIDFLNESLFKSSQYIPFKIPTKTLMFYALTINGEIHLVEFVSKQHYKIDLNEIIPKEMKQKYLKYYEPLIFGYCRESDSNNTPIYLMKLIAKYFPCFVLN